MVHVRLSIGQKQKPPDGHPAAWGSSDGETAQRSNRDFVILEKSGPVSPSRSASRVVGTSISRNVCLISTRRFMRQTARTNMSHSIQAIELRPEDGLVCPAAPWRNCQTLHASCAWQISDINPNCMPKRRLRYGFHSACPLRDERWWRGDRLDG